MLHTFAFSKMERPHIIKMERLIGSTETTVNFRSLSLSLCDNNENSVYKNAYDKQLSLSQMVTDSLIHATL